MGAPGKRVRFFVLCLLSFVLPSAIWAAGNQTSSISLKVSDGVQHLKCPAALWSSSHGAAVSSSDSKVATATLTTGRVTTPEVDITPVSKGSCTVTVKRSSTSTSDNYKWTITVNVASSTPWTRTVSGSDNLWVDAVWSTNGIGGCAWSDKVDAEITVAGTVTLDVGTGAVSAGAVTIKGTGDLTLRNYQNLTTDSIDLSGLDGTITYLYVSDSVNQSSGLQSKITNENDQKVKYGFAGTTAGNGWNIGSWTSSTTLKTHLVLESGTHSITWSGNSATADFAQNGTDENPTVLVRNGATLNFTAHDLSGYQSTFAAGGVIRVNAGGTLNFIENTSGSYHNFNYRQRLVLDPESLTTFKFRSGYLFTLHGAGATPGETVTAATANIYVPPSDGTKGPAVLRRATDGVTGLCINHTGSSRGGGCAIYVGENSKLLIDAPVQKGEENDSTSNKRILAKLGPGELEITGEVTSSVDFDARAGIITLPAGQGKFNKSFTATADVTYRFPEGWTAGTAYTLGSGTVSGTAPATDAATVYVGEEKLVGVTLVYSSSGKTVRYDAPLKPRTPVAKPVVAQGLVYGYTNQVGVAAGENYALSGVTVTNAVGTYEVTATLLDDDHCWDDQTTKPLKLTWSIACRAATVTVIDTNKVTGAKEPVFRTRNENFIADDPQKLVWTSFRTNTSEAAGMYDVIVRGAVRQGGYEITYVPGKLRIDEKPRIPIARPVAGTGFVYGYTNQSVVAAGEGYTLGGDLSASAVGKYETTVTLEDGYSWDDGTIEPLTFSWSIGYRKATVTVINTNKVTGAEEPFFRTRNENFLADDPTELEWIAWRTNTSEAVGTYDIVVDGEVHQGGYEITYVGGTLTITEAPPPGPTIVPVTEIPEVIRDVEPEDIKIVSESGVDITAAFTLTGSAAEGVTVTLNPKGAVTIGEGDAAETITVLPELTETGDKTVEPFEIKTDEVDIGVKTIPGLDYKLNRSTDVSKVHEGETVDEQRATTTRTRLRDPMKDGKPEKAFYVIEVGR